MAKKKAAKKKSATKKATTPPKTEAVDQQAKKALLKALKNGDLYALRDADKSLKADREIMLAAVKQRGAALSDAAKSLQADRGLVLAAVKQDGYALAFAAKSLQADRGLVLAAVKDYSPALEYADKSLRADREIVLAAVKQNGYALAFAARSLKADREVVLAAVKQDGLALEHAAKSLKADREVVLAAVQWDGTMLQYADKSLQADRGLVLAAVKQDGYALAFAAKSLKADRDFMLKLAKEHGANLEYAAKSLKADHEIVLAAVKRDSWALRYADKSLRADREIVLAAVKQRGTMLQYADKTLQADREIVLAAVKQDGEALQYAAPALQQDEELLRIARHNLSGKTFVLAGTLKTFSRAEAKAEIEALGGMVSGRVAAYKIVVVGKEPGAKAEKAKKLGAKTLKEAAFKRLIGWGDSGPENTFINIRVSGNGGEVWLGSVSKKAYDFWTGSEAEEHFFEYVSDPNWFVGERTDFKIPKGAELDSCWDMTDLGQEGGAFWEDSARLRILEMDGRGYEANQIRQIYDGTLGEFIEENEIEDNVTYEERQPDAKSKYYFNGVTMRGGDFDWETVEIPDAGFDPKKLRFSVVEILNYEFIGQISYGGAGYISLDETPDASSNDFELVGP